MSKPQDLLFGGPDGPFSLGTKTTKTSNQTATQRDSYPIASTESQAPPSQMGDAIIMTEQRWNTDKETKLQLKRNKLKDFNDFNSSNPGAIKPNKIKRLEKEIERLEALTFEMYNKNKLQKKQKNKQNKKRRLINKTSKVVVYQRQPESPNLYARIVFSDDFPEYLRIIHSKIIFINDERTIIKPADYKYISIDHMIVDEKPSKKYNVYGYNGNLISAAGIINEDKLKEFTFIGQYIEKKSKTKVTLPPSATTVTTFIRQDGVGDVMGGAKRPKSKPKPPKSAKKPSKK